MALSSFLNVNGYDFPPPRRGFSWTISTTVNAGRNANNAVIGDRVGRDLYKLDGIIIFVTIHIFGKKEI